LNNLLTNFYLGSRAHTNALGSGDLEELFDRALGSDKVAAFDNLNVRDKSTFHFRLAYQFRTSNSETRLLSSAGHLTVDPSGVSWLSLLADRRDAAFPPNDFGRYFTTISSKIALAIRAELVTIDDDSGITEQLKAALRSKRIPNRSEGYFLGAPFADRVGRDSLRAIVQEAENGYARALQELGLSATASIEEVSRLEDPPLIPRPLMEEYSDGSALVYGLLKGANYWVLLGL